MADWQIDSDEELALEGTLEELDVDLVAGDLTVTGAEGESRLRVSSVVGRPVEVHLDGGRLRIRQKGAGVASFGEGSSASVAVSVPTGCRLRANTVSASVLVEGLEQEARLETVSGEVGLERLSGPVRVKTVSGAVQARGESERLDGETVSGRLTVEDYLGGSVRLHTVSGELVADLQQAAPDASGDLGSVSGAVLLRLQSDASQRVHLNSVSGRLSSAFPDVHSDGGPARRSLSWTIGEGRGQVRVETVSGSISVLGERGS